jgi:hypothetical protein
VDLTCQDVWREISNYLDDEIDPALRSAVTLHCSECARCKALLDGLRNVISLYGDETLFAPAGDFHGRLHGFLADRVEGTRGSWWGWVAAIGFAGAAAAWLFLALPGRAEPTVRAHMSQPARQVTQQLVAVVDSGKLFHDPKCPWIHGAYRLVTSEEAIREGYTPCSRCLGGDFRSPGRSENRIDSGENQLAKSMAPTDH